MGIPFDQVRQWSAATITLYQVYYRMAPWGEERADLRNAMTMSQTANMHRDSRRHPKPFAVDDFMPFTEKREEGLDEVGLRQMFKSLARK